MISKFANEIFAGSFSSAEKNAVMRVISRSNPTDSVVLSYRTKDGKTEEFLCLAVTDGVIEGLLDTGEIIHCNISRRTKLPYLFVRLDNTFALVGDTVYMRSRSRKPSPENDPILEAIVSKYEKTLDDIFESATDYQNNFWVKTSISQDVLNTKLGRYIFDWSNYRLDTLDQYDYAQTGFIYSAFTGKLINKYDAQVLLDGRYVSKSSLAQGIQIICKTCGKPMTAHTTDELEIARCAECEAKIPNCAVCGRRGFKTIAGLTVCLEHMAVHHVGGYHSNTSRESPRMLGEPEESFPLYLGVELEVDADARGRIPAYPGLAIAHAMKITKDEKVEFTRDSSLSNRAGFEMISQPKTIRRWHEDRAAWKDLFEKLIKCGIRGHDAEGAGFHVHVSRDAFVEERKAFTRLQVILHRYFNNMLIISRREKRRVMDYAYPIDGMCDVEKFDTSHLSVLNKCKRLEYTGHSMLAVDGSVPTFEFRIFRSTLNIETFMATLDFVYGICAYVNTHNFNECNAVTWTELKAFIDSRDFDAYEERIMCQAKKPRRSNNELATSELDVEGEIASEEVPENMTAAGHSSLVSNMVELAC